ncbi:7309_t:CDS:1, partial [Cetraspora pellucida]
MKLSSFKLYILYAIIIFFSIILLLSTTIKTSTNEPDEFNEFIDSLIKENITSLMDKLKTKPTSLVEWKQRHYVTRYLNDNKTVKLYITSGRWYLDEDFTRLTYNQDGTLEHCDIPCIWKQIMLDSSSSTELESADAFFNVDFAYTPEQNLKKRPKNIKLTLEPKIHCPHCHNDDDSFDIYSSYYEDSDIPTSYVRIDPEIW